MAQTVMVISPYVIDVPLSVGGTIALHAQAGDRVIVLAMCYPGYPTRTLYPEARTPEGGPFGRFKNRETFKREVADMEKDAVARELGIESIVTFDYEPNSDALFDKDVVDRTTELLNEYQPDLVITYWPISNYTDFSGSTMAIMRAIVERPLKKMPQVYFAETLTGRHTLCFVPSAYVDITSVMEKKRRANEVIWQGKNLDFFYHPFSLPIAQFRGRECGAGFAEAYVALHGGFGLQKSPMRDSAEGAAPMTIQRSVQRLQKFGIAQGIVPKTYGEISEETARKVYGV